jgi:hypothetical protein
MRQADGFWHVQAPADRYEPQHFLTLIMRFNTCQDNTSRTAFTSTSESCSLYLILYYVTDLMDTLEYT